MGPGHVPDRGPGLSLGARRHRRQPRRPDGGAALPDAGGAGTGAAARQIGLRFAVNSLVRAQVERLYDEIEAEVGPPPARLALQSSLVLPFGLWTRFRLRHDLFTQAPPRRHEYGVPRQPGAAVRDRVVVPRVSAIK